MRNLESPHCLSLGPHFHLMNLQRQETPDRQLDTFIIRTCYGSADPFPKHFSQNKLTLAIQFCHRDESLDKTLLVCGAHTRKQLCFNHLKLYDAVLCNQNWLKT